MLKNRLTYIFLIVLSLFFKYNFGGFVPSVLFNTLISLLIISLGYTLYVYLRFKFVQSIDKKVIVKGENVKLIVKLSNEDILIFPYIYISFYETHLAANSSVYSKTLSINPFSKKEFIFDMESKFRGEYEVGINSIYIEDFLGLIKLKYKIPEPKKITVFPKIEHLSKFDIFSSDTSDSHDLSNGKIEDHNNFKDMRNYSYGDTLRRIHWKASARQNKLMVKNYHSTANTDANILLDIRQNATYSDKTNVIIEDKLTEAVISVLNYYFEKSIPVNFIYFDNKLEIINISNKTEFDFIYKTLASVKFTQTVSLADIINLHNQNSGLSADMIIFTSILDIELYNEIYKVQIANHNVCLIYISPKSLVDQGDDIVEDILDNLPEIGVKSYIINPDDDIKLILGG